MHTMIACQIKSKSKLLLKIKINRLIISLSPHFLTGMLEHYLQPYLMYLDLEGSISGDTLD